MGALAWLSVRVLQQDHELDSRRRRERLQVAAGRLALEIERRLEAVEDPLTQGHGIHFTANGIESAPGFAPLFEPDLPSVAHRDPAQVAEAEALEYRQGDLAAAAALYGRMAESPDPAIRARSLVGLARVLRKRREFQPALQAYSRLLGLGTTEVDGLPAELIARQGRCRAWEETGNSSELSREAREFARALYVGGWRIDQGTFLLYQDLLQRWGAPPPDPLALAKTRAVLTLWRGWRGGDLTSRGRRVLSSDDPPLLALWNGTREDARVWLASPAQLRDALGPVLDVYGMSVALTDPEGRLLLGSLPKDALSLTPGETHLPFVLNAASTDAGGEAAGDRARQMALIGTLALAFALTAASAFGLYRATTREMALARQKSDFVAAVSHEFRTPLTSIRHLTELLVTRAPLGEQRKEQYYGILAREAERLHKLVESLLSIGRIEAGAYAWHLEPANVGDLVRSAVEDFRHEARFENRKVVCETGDSLPDIRADREALALALANLLENAGKYSEPGTEIRVRTRREGHWLQISVEDQGTGIPADEQGKLFDKFVRGREARRLGIRGVGVAEAHGGAVNLESEPGRGSIFTLVIPCLES